MHSTKQIGPDLPFGFGRRVAGTLISLVVGALIISVFWSIQNQALSGETATRVDVGHLIRMTTIQAGLTTIISLIVGLLLAWSLNRLTFPGRDLIVGLFGAAIVMPGLVIALGLINVWGRAGWINEFLSLFGLKLGGNIFGLHGIIAAHVILDATFAARILLTRLDAIPASRLKIGRSLGLSPFTRFRALDWPALATAVPGLSAIIFLLAFTSFPIVLLLGGGPANQTLEVAIYSAVRLDFNLGAAVHLALVQLLVCAIVVLPAVTFNPAGAMAGNRATFHWPDTPWLTALQIVIVTLATIAFVLPLAAVLGNGLNPSLIDAITRPSFRNAALTSLAIGTISAIATLILALLLVTARAEHKNALPRALLAFPVYAYLLVPAVVLSLGFFLITRSFAIPLNKAAPFVLIIANTLLSLPYAVSTLGPPIEALHRRYGRLTQSLGMSGWQRWRLIEWPNAGREVGLALALGFCFSLGDLGVISLFGTEEFATLPWVMVRALGAFRTNDAAAISAILLITSLLIFWFLPKLFGRRNNAPS